MHCINWLREMKSLVNKGKKYQWQQELYGVRERDGRGKKSVSLAYDLSFPSLSTFNGFLILFPPMKNLLPR